MSKTPQRHFTHLTIPAEIWLRKDLSIQAKCLWAELRSLHDPQLGGCPASDDYLMEFLSLKRSRFYEVIKELKETGLLELVSFDGRSAIRRAVVPEVDYGSDCSQIPSVDSSCPENRTPVIRNTGITPYNKNASCNVRPRVGCGSVHNSDSCEPLLLLDFCKKYEKELSALEDEKAISSLYYMYKTAFPKLSNPDGWIRAAIKGKWWKERKNSGETEEENRELIRRLKKTHSSHPRIIFCDHGNYIEFLKGHSPSTLLRAGEKGFNRKLSEELKRNKIELD